MSEPLSSRLPPWPELAPFQPILEAANIIGLFEWDRGSGRIVPCLGMARLFGLDRNSILAGAPVEAFLPALHPDDRAAFSERARLDGLVATQMRYRLTDAAGREHAILECARYTLDAQGYPRWGCGALFEPPPEFGGALRKGMADERLIRAAQLAVELCETVRGLQLPALNALLKLTLHEIGSHIADSERQAATRTLN